jgi:formate dehydrogenase accessory protein FdhE
VISAGKTQSPGVQVLRALVEIDGELAPALPPGVPHPPAAEARLAAGLPALLDEPLVEGPALQKALRQVAGLLDAEPQSSTVRHTVESVAADEEFGTGLAAAALAGNWEAIETAATRHGLDPYASVVLLDYAVRPWLRLAALVVSPLVAASGWSGGRCPACGAPPLLAELRGPERERILRCGRCGSAWSFPRLACPACGERRHQRLSYLHDEGQAEFRRADVCETCRSYLKAVAVLDPLRPAALLETDFATVALDFAALERGYHRTYAQPPSPV